jgi:hypothetical protein
MEIKILFKKKWPDVRPDERLTSSRQASDVSPTPPDGLTSDVTTKIETVTYYNEKNNKQTKTKKKVNMSSCPPSCVCVTDFVMT